MQKGMVSMFTLYTDKGDFIGASDEAQCLIDSLLSDWFEDADQTKTMFILRDECDTIIGAIYGNEVTAFVSLLGNAMTYIMDRKSKPVLV